MLPRGAAAEVGARQQNLRALIAREVQHEIRIGRLALTLVTQVGEEIRAEPGARNLAQESLRNDLIRIDVGPIQRHHQAVERRKWLHTPTESFPRKPMR